MFNRGNLGGSCTSLSQIWRGVVFCGSVIWFSVAFGATGASLGGGQGSVLEEASPTVVVVSFDGFRFDYLGQNTPHLDKLKDRGVWAAEGLISVYPSLTFPSHYSIATGLKPNRHGIVGNRFYDSYRNQWFGYQEGDTHDSSWWGGEPIWVTAEKQGLTAATCFFVGSDEEIVGVRPTYWRTYDKNFSNASRVEEVIHWLSLPESKRPQLVMTYFSLVDTAGHAFGPDSSYLKLAITQADALLGSLMEGIASSPNAANTHLIVVSDHGMATVDKSRSISLELDDPESEFVGEGLVWSSFGHMMTLHLEDKTRQYEIRSKLAKKFPQATVGLFRVFPEEDGQRDIWRDRMGDIYVRTSPLGVVVATQAELDTYPPGMHGWDPRYPKMRGILLGAGPQLASNTPIVGEVQGVDVYPLVAHLLGLSIAPNLDGRLSPFEGVLQKSTGVIN